MVNGELENKLTELFCLEEIGKTISIHQALFIVCYSFEVFMDPFYVLDNGLETGSKTAQKQSWHLKGTHICQYMIIAHDKWEEGKIQGSWRKNKREQAEDSLSVEATL